MRVSDMVQFIRQHDPKSDMPAPWSAMVLAVHSDRLVDLMIYPPPGDRSGLAYIHKSQVLVVMNNEKPPIDGSRYCQPPS